MRSYENQLSAAVIPRLKEKLLEFKTLQKLELDISHLNQKIFTIEHGGEIAKALAQLEQLNVIRLAIG